jgi:hypothetical protein
MKKLITIILLAFCINASGQSKQVKVLLQQISALRTYGGYLAKGYQIAQKGLSAIGDLKRGELSLHTAFYNALATVNPAVSGYTRVSDIKELLEAIIREREQLQTIMAAGSFAPEERHYIGRVDQRLSGDCQSQLELLYVLLTDDELEMDDAERIKRIDDIYLEMTDNYSFTRNFKEGVLLLHAVRSREQRDITQGRKLMGIPTLP